MSGSMLASAMPEDWADCPLVVVREQAPIRVYFTDEDGNIVINQQKWREPDDEVFIMVRPEHVRTLCKALFKEAGIDVDTNGCEVGVKDATATERQRRHREKQRDCHGGSTVTVTAGLAGDIDEHHSESGSTTPS